MASRSTRFHDGESHNIAFLCSSTDITKPYMINFLSRQAATIELLKKDNEERKAREASQEKKEEDTPILGSRLMLTQGPMGSAPSPGPYGQANGIAPQPTGYRAF